MINQICCMQVNSLTFYGALASYIQTKHSGRVVFNSGTHIPCPLAKFADIVMDAEIPSAEWTKTG